MDKGRKNFHIRLQPDSESLLGEVIDYLQTLKKEELNKRVGELLVAAFLPLARYHQNTSDSEELRITCINSCDALSRHSEYLRQLLKVNHPTTLHLVLSSNVVADPNQIVSQVTHQASPVVNQTPEQNGDKEVEEDSSPPLEETDDVFGGFDD